MSGRWVKEHMKALYLRYEKANRREKKVILDEVCKTHGYHRKHAIRLLNGAPPRELDKPRSRRRAVHYDPTLIAVLQAIWEAAGYLWSRRLKAALPLWMPWARERFRLTDEQVRLLLCISAAQIDRRLAATKRKLKRRIYGRTKPGSLLKHHIPIKTDAWNVRRPGFFEVDLVSHSGNSADGIFAYTLNMTDIKTGWVERRAILGKSRQAVVDAIDDIKKELPFTLLGIDSDNGSEFINDHLYAYCRKRKIQFTRGRAYKKDDNAHIEQKNWTHVRQLFGYVRYDTPEAVAAMNALYRGPLRLYQNLFQPSVKLKKKIHIGSKIKRIYSPAKTPFERVLECKKTRRSIVVAIKTFRTKTNPFDLSRTVDRGLKIVYETTPAKKADALRSSVSRVSNALLRRPEPHQYFQLKDHATQGPPPDLFTDLRCDPVFQLQQRLEKLSAMPK